MDNSGTHALDANGCRGGQTEALLVASILVTMKTLSSDGGQPPGTPGAFKFQEMQILWVLWQRGNDTIDVRSPGTPPGLGWQALLRFVSERGHLVLPRLH